jgi:hypothetical protein
MRGERHPPLTYIGPWLRLGAFVRTRKTVEIARYTGAVSGLGTDAVRPHPFGPGDNVWRRGTLDA